MIGYYVHHHGRGHLARARAIAAWSPDDFMLLGSGLEGVDDLKVVVLGDDRLGPDDRFDGVDDARRRPPALHYAPTDHAGVRRRVAQMARWIDEHRPSLMVVDVSVEVAMLARICGVPTVYVRLAGDRTDRPHLDAFAAAEALISPFDAALEPPSTPGWVVDKTRYMNAPVAPSACAPVIEDRVLVVFGGGGGEADGRRVAEAARSTPAFQWRVIGPVSDTPDPPSNLELLGWVDDAEAEIAQAGLVVGSGGDGVVGAVFSTGRPFICLPQARPFDEQRVRARAMAEAGWAVTLDQWPTSDAWPDVIAQARAAAARRPAIADTASSPTAIADWLIGLAGRMQEGFKT